MIEIDREGGGVTLPLLLNLQSICVLLIVLQSKY